MRKWLHDNPWIWIVLLIVLMLFLGMALVVISILNEPEIVK